MNAALALVAWAHAEIEPPDYRSQLVAAAQAEVERLRVAEGMERAAAFAASWTRTVVDDGRVAYALGLGYRLEGDDARARAALDRAIELDPELAAARYDRGELRLQHGDLDGAEADFLAVVRLRPEHWAGHFRLADVAARRGQGGAFEAHLVDALRTGFSFRSLVGDSNWRRYLDDPQLGPRARRLVEVYQDAGVLRELLSPSSDGDQAPTAP